MKYLAALNISLFCSASSKINFSSSILKIKLDGKPDSCHIILYGDFQYELVSLKVGTPHLLSWERKGCPCRHSTPHAEYVCISLKVLRNGYNSLLQNKQTQLCRDSYNSDHLPRWLSRSISSR